MQFFTELIIFKFVCSLAYDLMRCRSDENRKQMLRNTQRTLV